MSDIHVLTGYAGHHKIVVHGAMPDATNAVGVNWRTALVRSGVGGRTSLPDGDGLGGTITAAEKAKVESGELFEQEARFPLESGGTTPDELRQTLQAFCTRERTTHLGELQSRLRYYGYTTSEA